MLIIASVVVKIISALYKIPLTSFIGATGRGYFACAYNLFMPIHIITMGSFPIALSQLVSRYNSTNNQLMIKSLKVSANRIFFAVGFLGMMCVLVFAIPYCNYIAKSPNSLLTVLVLAPGVLFSTMSASYRGFFEGFMDMKPTSVSQTIDALVKAIFGLLFARVSMLYLYNAYQNKSLSIFDNVFNDADALSVIYPITTAFAMLGVTFGTIVSYVYLTIYSKKNYVNNIKLTQNNINSAAKELFDFSIAIMLSCIVQSIFQFLDTASVQLALTSLDSAELKNIFSECLKYNNIKDEDLYTYAYGIFNSAIDFKNIIPGITMAIGVCAVPAISSAYHNRNKYRLKSLSNMIFKYTTMLSTCCGVFLGVESTSVLNLFYKSNHDIVVGCDTLVKLFSFTILAYCFAGSAIFCVQAIGRPKKSIMPFIVGGVVRVLLNIILVSNDKFNLYATVISGFIGYMIIAIWNLAIFSKYSKTKVSINECFIKPIFVAILTLLIYMFALSHIILTQNICIILIIKGILFLTIYLICSIIFKILDVKDLFSGINCKKHG